MAKPKTVAKVAAEGHVFLVAPEDVSSCSSGGEEYLVDDDGTVEVLAEHAAALVDHGFLLAEGESPPPAE
jgi:hypothetical protein